MKILSYLWALLILIAPFFISANIFEDGSVSTSPPTPKAFTIVNCAYGTGNVQLEGLNPTSTAMSSACLDKVKAYNMSTSGSNACNGKTSGSEESNGLYYSRVTWKYESTPNNCNYEGSSVIASYGSNVGTTQVELCPENALSIEVNDTTYCYTANDAQLGDTCNYNDVYSNPVTESAACIVKNDGSKCAVSAVDIGGGNSVYMPTENDCYSDVYPILDENGGIGDMPDGSDEQCTESGALSYCPADPEDECTDSQCNEGCGYMNGQFICVSPTPDSPDPNNPDPNNPDPNNPDPNNPDPNNPDPDGDDGSGSGGECAAGDTTCGNGGGTGPCEVGSTDCVPCTEGDTNCSLVKGEKGSFDMEAAEAELEEMKQKFTDKFDEIRSEASTLIPEINGGSGSFSNCYDVVSFNGKKINRCVSQFSDEMSQISKALLLIFTLIAAFIVIKGVTKK